MITNEVAYSNSCKFESFAVHPLYLRADRLPLHTAEVGTIVEAAHIEQWSKTQNDEITNGLALSKSPHWS